MIFTRPYTYDTKVEWYMNSQWYWWDLVSFKKESVRYNVLLDPIIWLYNNIVFCFLWINKCFKYDILLILWGNDQAFYYRIILHKYVYRSNFVFIYAYKFFIGIYCQTAINLFRKINLSCYCKRYCFNSKYYY